MKPLYAVVSLLDPVHYGQVEQLWTALRERCGVTGIYKTPFPHFSYHVAAGYELDRLAKALRRLAAGVRPFRVRTTGLGIFCGASPVVYVPVVRDPGLSAVHRRLWNATSTWADGTLDYYHPDRWVPHITLGHGDITRESLPGVIAALSGEEFHWEIPIDNLAIISSCGSSDGLHLRVPLQGT